MGWVNSAPCNGSLETAAPPILRHVCAPPPFLPSAPRLLRGNAGEAGASVQVLAAAAALRPTPPGHPVVACRSAAQARGAAETPAPPATPTPTALKRKHHWLAGHPSWTTSNSFPSSGSLTATWLDTPRSDPTHWARRLPYNKVGVGVNVRMRSQDAGTAGAPLGAPILHHTLECVPKPRVIHGHLA